MADRLDKLDYYTLLGLETHADADAIRAAFHKFALKFHPDNHGGSDQQLRATQIFRRGTEAYRVLKDPKQRRAYDEALAAGRLRLKSDEEAASVKKKRPVNMRARPFFVKAQKALRDGQMAQAKLNLNIALQHEPDHPDLLALKSEIQ